MELIYDGTLDSFTYDMVKSCLRERACPIEVEKDIGFWEKFNTFSKTKMKQVRKNLEHDDGSPRIYEGSSWTTLHKNAEDDIMFIFFQFESDRKAFLEEFAYLKTNGMPFKTLIK